MVIALFIILLALVYVYLSRRECPDDTYNEEYSKVYDTIWFDKKRYESEVQYIFKNVSTPRVEAILDLGCGTGNHLHLWKGVWPESTVTGMDLSADQISRARVKNPDTNIVQGSYLDRKVWRDEIFDVIACMYGAGQYSQDTQRLIQNVYTWLKPGGTFVFHGINPRRLCDGCEQTASNTDLPLRADRKGHCNVLYPNLVYSSWWTTSMFSNWVRYNETFYPMKGTTWPKDWDVSSHVGNNVPLGMKRHPTVPKLMTNGHKLYLLPPSHIVRLGRQTGFSKVELKHFDDSSQGSEEYFIFFKK